MRLAFWSIANGWKDDDLARLSERMEATSQWLKRNGGAACAEADEQETMDLMFRKQTVLAVREGAYEPFVSAALDDDEILRTMFGHRREP
jgi:hypothetical protein